MRPPLTDPSYIKDLLSRHGFRFSKALGQNFLVAPWVPEEIAQSAGLDGSSGVVEVGPGIGCLTQELARRAGKVVSIELDRRLEPVLKETLAGLDVKILFADVLKTDLGELTKRELSGLSCHMCANLPYNITSPVLTAAIKSGAFETITVMIQREVARRICSQPGTADYGAFGIFVQWHCDTELLFDVPPSCFMPQPKVTSSVIRLVRRQAPPAEVKDEELFHRVVRCAFSQRRKTLANALIKQLGLSRAQAEGAIAAAGFDTKIRGEVLDIGGFAKISDKIADLGDTDL